jgi:hypothetical protein
MYEVKLDAFNGPLDLLLHLIQKFEIDIYASRSRLSSDCGNNSLLLIISNSEAMTKYSLATLISNWFIA